MGKRSFDGARYVNHDYGDDDRTDPSDIFREEVQRDPEVCSNCFRKNYDVVLPWSWKAQVRKGLVRYFIPANSTTEKTSVVDDDRAANPKRACACGRIGNYTNRPLPKDRAIEYAWNLSRTLAKDDVEHNPLVLVLTVALRKSVPRYGSRDDENFAAAVANAVPETSTSLDDLLRDGIRDEYLEDLAADDGHRQTSRDVAEVRGAPALPEGTGDRRFIVRPFVTGE